MQIQQIQQIFHYECENASLALCKKKIKKHY